MAKILLTLGLSFLLFQSSYGVFVVTLTESGADVVATGQGDLDITGLALSGNIPSVPRGLYPTNQVVRAGSTAGGNINYYTGFTSTPGAYGTGGFTAASSGTGELVAVNNTFVRIFDAYISGAPLSTTNTYTGASLASLGVTPGTYTWEWSSDSYVLNAQIPEPSTYALVAAALGLILVRAVRKDGLAKRHSANSAP